MSFFALVAVARAGILPAAVAYNAAPVAYQSSPLAYNAYHAAPVAYAQPGNENAFNWQLYNEQETSMHEKYFQKEEEGNLKKIFDN